MGEEYETMNAELVERLKGLTAPVVLRCTAVAPYEGCWEEPNHWLLKDRKFFPLYVSGIASQLFLLNSVEAALRPISWDDFVDTMREYDDRYTEWDYENPGDRAPGNNYLNAMTVLLHRHGVQSPKWNCVECSRDHQGVAHFLSYRGNGGVGIFLEMPVCDECFDAQELCASCYSGVDEEGYCESCDGCMGVCPPEDQAVEFGLDGSKFLAAGESQGPPPVIVIMSKGVSGG